MNSWYYCPNGGVRGQIFDFFDFSDLKNDLLSATDSSGNPYYKMLWAPHWELSSSSWSNPTNNEVTGITNVSDFLEGQTGLMAATDFRFGSVSLTPSITVFGGRSYIAQDFFEISADLAGNPSSVEGYAATSTLRWTDVGAKFGLEGRAELTPILGVGLKGSVGAANRNVNLTAHDAPGFVLSLFFPPASIDTSTNTVPFLANGEASIFVKSPSSNAMLRVFGGINYDSRIPGISAPVIVSSVPGTPGIPAGIKFDAATSFYVGGGMHMKFAGP